MYKLNLIFSIGLFVLCSCGGGTAGTSGTGETKLRLISGTVVDGSDTPVKGVSVTLLGKDSGAITDERGEFSLVEETSTQISLTFKSGESSMNLKVPAIEEAAQTVTVNAIIDKDSNEISAESIEGQVLADGDCFSSSKSEGDTLDIVLPAGRIQCSLTYVLRGRILSSAQAGINMTTSGCAGVSFSTSGSQLIGKRFQIYQQMTGEGIRGQCIANAKISVSGLHSVPTFILRISQAKAGEDLPVQNLKVKYSGLLKRELTHGDCQRFSGKTERVLFSVDGNNLAVSLPDESLSFEGRVDRRARSDSDRYKVLFDLSSGIDSAGTVSISPRGSLGRNRVGFLMSYITRSGTGTSTGCENMLSGTLNKN